MLSIQVGEAVCLESLSYHEAWELSYFGASVLHPRTTMPAIKYSIHLTIRSFFNRSAAGVCATRDAQHPRHPLQLPCKCLNSGMHTTSLLRSQELTVEPCS